ncbi:hypothetical protein NL676_024821 [Syzygium grande]|nr:hypothetical protein NL676_024821 [Syzygium grande]
MGGTGRIGPVSSRISSDSPLLAQVVLSLSPRATIDEDPSLPVPGFEFESTGRFVSTLPTHRTRKRRKTSPLEWANRRPVSLARATLSGARTNEELLLHQFLSVPFLVESHPLIDPKKIVVFFFKAVVGKNLTSDDADASESRGWNLAYQTPPNRKARASFASPTHLIICLRSAAIITGRDKGFVTSGGRGRRDVGPELKVRA